MEHEIALPRFLCTLKTTRVAPVPFIKDSQRAQVRGFKLVLVLPVFEDWQLIAASGYAFLVCENAIMNLEGNMIVFCFFQGAELAGRAAIAMSASDTQAVSMVPASSPGSVTARKAGGAFSATRVSPSFYDCLILSKHPDAHWKSRFFLYLILGFLPPFLSPPWQT